MSEFSSLTYTKRRLMDLSHAVGNTPLFVISIRYKGELRTLYAKAEHYNLTGSIKDRLALFIINKAFEAGDLRPGMRLAEATSGNTGISFVALGSAVGLSSTIFMPNWMSEERKSLIKGFGAEIRLVSKEEGGFLGSIRLSEELAAGNPEIFLPKQFANPENVMAHTSTTGPEIAAQLASIGKSADAVVAGVGTGGTIMGVGRYLKSIDPKVKVHPLEPANSPTMSTGTKVGSHRVQGISDEFIPPIVKLNELDEIIAVDDGDAIIMAQKLAAVGIGVGISSGANLLGALKAQNKLNPNAVVVTLLPDDNKKYLSTDLFRNEPIKEGFLTNDIEIVDFSLIPRLAAPIIGR